MEVTGRRGDKEWLLPGSSPEQSSLRLRLSFLFRCCFRNKARKGLPYCHIPCYSALFGPTMFGHGSTVEAHKNFGKQADANMKNSPMKKPDLLHRIKLYNDFYEGKNLQVKTREVNGRLVLEAPLRIYWGVTSPIQLQQKDDTILPKEWRRSYCQAMANGLDADLLQKMDNEGETKLTRRSSLEDLLSLVDLSDKTKQPGGKYNTVTVRGEGGKRRRKNREKRLSIINGHLYNVETSVFTPAHGSVTNVTITSLDPAPEVIKSLLEKFKVENNPDDFCLCTVKSNGELRTLRDADYPLLERVMMGPLEDEGKIFILDKDRARDVSQEVAQYVTLPEPMLHGFLEKYKKEEEEEISRVKEKFKIYRQIITDRLSAGSTVTKL